MYIIVEDTKRQSGLDKSRCCKNICQGTLPGKVHINTSVASDITIRHSVIYADDSCCIRAKYNKRPDRSFLDQMH